MSRSALNRADMLAEAGRQPEALALYRRIWQDDPTCTRAGVALLEAAMSAGDSSAALRIIRALDPGDYAVMDLERELGLMLYARNWWEAAAPLLARAAAREPWDKSLQRCAARVALPDHLAPVDGGLKRFSAREGERYIFVIDVVGTCNLRCPTCPVGNTPLGDRGLGFMPFEMFEQIIDKITREAPCKAPIINLFNWGEPLLHPDLPRMIALLNQHGMTSHLSSNLNIKRGLRAVIAANPTSLKISLSGFSPQTYGRAHKRGNLELVQENMRALRGYLDETGAQTRIWVGQHVYRSNQHEVAQVQAFAAELGFDHAPIQAFYMPLERVVDHIHGVEVPANDGILADLLTQPADRSGRPDAPGQDYDCELRFNQTVINHDGSVALCCSVYEQPQMLGVQFLDVPFDDLTARKYAHDYCGTCRGYGLHFAPPRQEV